MLYRCTMTQCKLNNNDLNIIFIESDEVPIVYRLDNGAEIEFINDSVSMIVLPNLTQQIPFSPISDTDISLNSIKEIDEDLVEIQLIIQDKNMNIKLDISSLNRKVYI